jgi:predicted metal-binding protein
MNEKTSVKVGIVIYDRYRSCASGKCFRSLQKREGAFSLYKDKDAVLVGYATCDGCPGGNIEYVPEEMVRNGVDTIPLATGLIVGYPPCPRIATFRDFIQSRYSVGVVLGTHPIPQKYYRMHQKLRTWNAPHWQEVLQHVLMDEPTRILYD